MVVQVLGCGPVPREAEEAWVERAREATIKRLRDERRALLLQGVVEPASHEPIPMEDAAWHASLRQEPGCLRARVLELGHRAARGRGPDVFLRLRLPEDLASSFTAAVESRRWLLTREVERVPWDEPWPDPGARPSVLAARMFSARCRRVPAWVGLLAMLEDYVETWDHPGERPARAAGTIYVRDGWRCSAPGCTSRRHLEDHHLVYRSRGGDRKEPSNRICLCRFHHQRGEHGGLASCRGRAPLGIVWRLGRGELAVSFRNERRVGGASPQAGP
jgi:5-methylcytosine-specific restriction endonuclease McrA